ncbi:hypothetical protein EEB18_008920 [Sphingopyxis sp. OPL5]|uniref:hypothetical protein n=1 Tax=Sphingopyxis sp. OPL5 TaxID=2486273 RepID=UPI00164D8D82|nr:hypothetical protein [Sphingopyxis sp. OPL5]QNO29034.1 hypothetical protein EEB18_008920 [Sphingopyxis sp. OPL5]
MKGPREKPLGLDMPFDEALARFMQTNPDEVEELAKKRRRKNPPPGIAETPKPADD